MQITVYGSDECISRVRVSQVAETSGKIVNKWDDVYYGDTAVIDATYIDGCYIKFEALSAEGCRFTRWAYRVIAIYPDEDAQYTELHPYTYYGDYDIYIRAEGEIDDEYEGGGEEGETWGVHATNYGTLKYDKTEEISLEPYTLYCREVTFSGNGMASICTEGSVDTIGWISTSTSWSDGEPTNWLVEDDDSGTDSNFYIDYEVKANTTYYVWLRCLDPSGSGTTTLKIYTPDIPAKWDWESAGATSDATQMKTAHNAVLYNGKTTDFSFYVWDDLCNKVNELLHYKGRTWDTFYATLLNTRMKYNDKELSALRFNSLRNNLDFAWGTGMDKVEPDDDVLGSYFIALANCINDCIDSL